jgi:uncharacterized membrane protein
VKRILIFLSLFMAAGAQEALSQNYNFQVIDFPGAVSTGADGVNNLGQVVGGYFDGVTGHGFMYDGNGFVTIDYTNLQGSTSLKDINDSGKIVGGFSQTVGNTYYTNDFIYDGQSFTSLAFPGSFIGQTETSLNGINDAGVVAGGYYDWADNSSNGFLYENGNISILTSAAIFSDVNDTGLMTGYEPDFYASFIFDGTTLEQINFDPLHNPYGIDIWAEGINDAGSVVGNFYDSDLNTSVGFIYDSATGGVTSLLYPGSQYTTLNGINDLGQLVGSFGDSNNVTHGFLATPIQASVPEPSLFAMLASVFAAAGAYRFFLIRPQETQSAA